MKTSSRWSPDARTACADPRLVAVGGGRVDVAVAGRQRARRRPPRCPRAAPGRRRSRAAGSARRRAARWRDVGRGHGHASCRARPARWQTRGGPALHHSGRPTAPGPRSRPARRPSSRRSPCRTCGRTSRRASILRSVGGCGEAALAELVEDARRRSTPVVSRPTKSSSVERPHRVAGAGLHRVVDLGDRADALLVGADRVEHVGHQQAVDDEAGLVLGRDASLPERLAELEAGVEGLVARSSRAHDLERAS